METEFAVPNIAAKYIFKTGETAQIMGIHSYRGMSAMWIVKVGNILQLMETQDIRFEVFGEYSLTPENGDRFKRRVEHYPTIEKNKPVKL